MPDFVLGSRHTVEKVPVLRQMGEIDNKLKK